MPKGIDVCIEKKKNDNVDSKIPKNIIQTYKTNILNDCIYNNTMEMININPILLEIIREMVNRIYIGEQNIFLATGPTLFTDVVYNLICKTNIYNTKKELVNSHRLKTFMNNVNYNDGLILHICDLTLNFHDKFIFNL